MIPVERARQLVLKHCAALSRTRFALSESSGFVLAGRVKARTALPRFDASAVDGYAVRVTDISESSPVNRVTLPIQDILRAGDSHSITLRPGHAIRILTGAMMPRGADAVVMQEHVNVEQGKVTFASPASVGDGIRFSGEEFKVGATVLEPGTLITPPVVAMLATLGERRVRVYRKPRVAIVTTGDELRAAGSRLKRGQIYDSNTPGLTAALHALGIGNVESYRAPDDPKRIEHTFRRAMRNADVVISSGGVSVGSSDFVKAVLETLQVRTVFWRIAVKPGKPLYFGTRGKKLVFGLPGNPVSALLGFQLFIRPALLRMMGATDVEPSTLTALLAHDLKKKPGRMEFVRGVLTSDAQGRLHARATRGQDSHMMGGLAAANCLIHFPQQASLLEAGNEVRVSLLRWAIL
jgi:molybdopterin molybdotransferase